MSASTLSGKGIGFASRMAVFAVFVTGFALTVGNSRIGIRLIGLACLCVAVIALMRAVRSLLPEARVPSIEELEERGIVVTSEYEALRAVAIEEFEDEGSCYLLELRDGSTLCLRGQYLYDYEGGKSPDYPQEPSLARRFPNTRFQVKRRREFVGILDIVCLGEAFEPILTASAYSVEDFKMDRVISDGEIATGFSFDELIQSKGRLPKSTTKV